MRNRNVSYLRDVSPRRRPFLDFAAINDAARRALPYIVRQWLPHGRREDNEYVARNPKRCDVHLGSFKINVKTGMWADFATDARGRDVVSLASYLFDLPYYDAAASVARMLNLGADGEVVR